MCTFTTLAKGFLMLKKPHNCYENNGTWEQRKWYGDICTVESKELIIGRQETWFSLWLCQYQPCDLGQATWTLLTSISWIRKWGAWVKWHQHFRRVLNLHTNSSAVSCVQGHSPANSQACASVAQGEGRRPMKNSATSTLHISLNHRPFEQLCENTGWIQGACSSITSVYPAIRMVSFSQSHHS